MDVRWSDEMDIYNPMLFLKSLWHRLVTISILIPFSSTSLFTRCFFLQFSILGLPADAIAMEELLTGHFKMGNDHWVQKYKQLFFSSL